jgi:hypothetical protein
VAADERDAAQRAEPVEVVEAAVEPGEEELAEGVGKRRLEDRLRRPRLQFPHLPMPRPRQFPPRRSSTSPRTYPAVLRFSLWPPRF